MVEFITGDLLKAPEKYIVHQTNCVSQGPAGGLAYFLFKQFAYADCYVDRKDRSIPGTLDIRGDGVNNRFIVNLMGQYYPGGPIDKCQDLDGESNRKVYFHKALNRLSQVDNLESVAFPFRIGCGIAGGNWDWYLNMINKFSVYVFNKQQVRVVIYQREEDK